MAFLKYIAIAYRNLLRHGRRTFLTALAVALGLVVTMAMSSMIDGMLTTVLDDAIRLSTGHLQIRNSAYDEERGALLSENLLRDPEGLATQVEALPEVASAAPVLWLGGLLSTAQESAEVQIVGIDMNDAYHAPIRDGIVAGSYPSNSERRVILMGQRLANQMNVGVGERVSLIIGSASGEGEEGVFTIAGLVDTGFPSIDQTRVIMPLPQAQSFSGVGDRFSTLIVMLHNQDDAEGLAAAFQDPNVEVLTWETLNQIIVESVEVGVLYYYVLYAIVFVAVAVIIANTLLMSVFSRAREIGILGALGMNRRQIILLFLVEGVLLAILGTAIGLVLGMGVVLYMTYVGISFPAETASLVEGFPIGTTMYGGIAPAQFVLLSLMLLAIVSLISLYPAWFAARMEPVEALHAL